MRDRGRRRLACLLVGVGLAGLGAWQAGGAGRSDVPVPHDLRGTAERPAHDDSGGAPPPGPEIVVEPESGPARVPGTGAGSDRVPLPAHVLGVAEGPSSDDFPGAPPPNPDIAAGPEDLLLGVAGGIARIPNPTAGRRQLARGLSIEEAVPVPLTTWLGPAIDPLCPTVPRTTETCLLGDPVVRYDQMQGRFLVAFTVTDTGKVGGILTHDRKASWALFVSRLATLGADPFFPPGATSGINPAAWTLFIGDVNALPGISGSGTSFDCSPGGVGGGPEVCYFPTSARLGIDNDTIQIASSVINDNVPEVNRGEIYNPPFTEPAYGGTRLRVLKKSWLYTTTNGTSLLFANQFNSIVAARLSGGAYDLYTSPDGLGAPAGLRPYTVVASLNLPTLGQPVTPPQPVSLLSPLFYEPIHLRGRTGASFANQPSLSSGGGQSSQSYLVGTIATPAPGTTSSLFLQRIQHAYQSTPPVQGPGVFYPGLGNGVIPFSSAVANSQKGLPEIISLGTDFSDPGTVTQANARTGQVAPLLYVGDDRPHRVIFREGHLYDARVATTLLPGLPNTTVSYDIIQKLGSTTAGTVFASPTTSLQAFAPGLDVTAGVTIGPGSTPNPVTLLPFLERLFVGTTFPQLRALTTPAGYPGILDGGGQPIPAAQCLRVDPLNPAALGYPGLFDIRCGEDAYDSSFSVLNPATGTRSTVFPWGIRGGASTDPNNLGLWFYGAYARGRQAGFGRWGTYIAHYPLSFPVNDPYSDLQSRDLARASFIFPFSQIARQTGIGPDGLTFDPGIQVTRGEMARWVVRSQMDEAAVTSYLDRTGGPFSSFADVGTGNANWHYIEVMYRRGYTKGCNLASEPSSTFCPDNPLTRGEMAVFVIRAKLHNVFSTVLLSGCPTDEPIASCGAGIDNFGLFVPATPFFSDVLPTNQYFAFIQKMRELRISVGSGGDRVGTGASFRTDERLTRGQLLAFIVRAFFP